ncbi:MAG: septum formation initiator family protein [Candidatus Omnitrophota bacterium]|nr:septum formation initiator family protein [Candidatus Omnitrophota bacterium]
MESKRIIRYLLISLAVFCIVFLPGFFRLRGLRQQNEQLQKRIRLLKEHNDQLKEELVKMRQDPAYIEKKARDKLGIVRKGEIIYRKKQ